MRQLRLFIQVTHLVIRSVVSVEGSNTPLSRSEVQVRFGLGPGEHKRYCPGYINHPIVGHQQAKVPYHMMEFICGQRLSRLYAGLVRD